MSDDSDFFGDVFENPEDDPLLGGGDSSPDKGTSGPPNQQGPPSWMSEAEGMNGDTTSTNGEAGPPPNQKQIVVDQRGNSGEDIDALNQAVGQGWRLVRISLTRPDGEQVATSQEAHRFVAILEQDGPQSLFDFGAGT